MSALAVMDGRDAVMYCQTLLTDVWNYIVTVDCERNKGVYGRQ